MHISIFQTLIKYLSEIFFERHESFETFENFRNILYYTFVVNLSNNIPQISDAAAFFVVDGFVYGGFDDAGVAKIDDDGENTNDILCFFFKGLDKFSDIN